MRSRQPVCLPDDWLLDRVFEPLSSWTARWWTPFAAARFLLTGCMLAKLVYGATILDYPLRLLSVLCFLVIYSGQWRMVGDAERTSSVWMPNPLRYKQAYTRVLWLGLLACSAAEVAILSGPLVQRIGEISDALTQPLFWMALYFSACKHRPPPVRRTAPSLDGLASDLDGAE